MKTLINSLLAYIVALVSLTCTSNKKATFSLQNQVEKRIGHFDKVSAENYFIGRRALIHDLLAPNIDPYKGADALPAKCRIENLPAPREFEDSNQRVLIFSFYSSGNRVLGLCADPDLLTKTQYLVLYCKRSGLLSLFHYFYDSSLEWLDAPVSSCPK